MDFETPASWFERVDSPIREFWLGYLYENGKIGDKPDPDRAKLCYEIEASIEWDEALFSL